MPLNNLSMNHASVVNQNFITIRNTNFEIVIENTFLGFLLPIYYAMFKIVDRMFGRWKKQLALDCLK